MLTIYIYTYKVIKINIANRAQTLRPTAALSKDAAGSITRTLPSRLFAVRKVDYVKNGDVKNGDVKPVKFSCGKIFFWPTSTTFLTGENRESDFPRFITWWTSQPRRSTADMKRRACIILLSSFHYLMDPSAVKKPGKHEEESLHGLTVVVSLPDGPISREETRETWRGELTWSYCRRFISW